MRLMKRRSVLIVSVIFGAVFIALIVYNSII